DAIRNSASWAIRFAGLTPGEIGPYQLNLDVPTSFQPILPGGDEVRSNASALTTTQWGRNQSLWAFSISAVVSHRAIYTEGNRSSERVASRPLKICQRCLADPLCRGGAEQFMLGHFCNNSGGRMLDLALRGNCIILRHARAEIAYLCHAVPLLH